MSNILYIHGFNGSPNGSTGKFIKKYFSKDNVIAPEFDLLNFYKTTAEIQDILYKEQIDIIVAHSFGAFYAFATRDECFKIVINPCMLPSQEIPALSSEPLSEAWIKTFEKQIEYIYNHIGGELCQTTFGIFGTNDELFSYKDLFAELYGTNSLRGQYNYVELPGGHRLPAASLERGLSRALCYAEVFDPNFRLQEAKLNEAYLNVFTHEKDELVNFYKDQIFDMLNASYQEIGGVYGLKNADALVTDSDVWKIDKTNNHINAVAIYTTQRGGRKLQYACCDGTDLGKDRLYKIIKADIAQTERNAWAEVSGKLEHIYLKQGAIKLPIETVKSLMPDKRIYELAEEDVASYKGVNDIADGFHYKREIGGHFVIKLCVYSGKDFQ